MSAKSLAFLTQTDSEEKTRSCEQSNKKQNEIRLKPKGEFQYAVLAQWEFSQETQNTAEIFNKAQLSTKASAHCCLAQGIDNWNHSKSGYQLYLQALSVQQLKLTR